MEELLAISYFEISLRLLLAAVLGGLIGYEREQSNHFAGFRTHILVSIGSTLIMLISIYGFTDFLMYENVNFDPSRIAAQVVTGVGFLGAGTILRHGFTVTGLTTAASLWVVAAIGLAIGAGFYYGAALSTLLVLISLAVLSKLDPLITKKKNLVRLKIIVIDSPGKLGEIATKIGDRRVNVKKISISDERLDKEIKNTVVINLLLKIPKNEKVYTIIDEIKLINGVKEVQFGKNTE